MPDGVLHPERYSVGKTLSLAFLLREHCGALESDLLKHFGVDLLDVWRFDSDGNRKLSYRRIMNLVKFLPTDSATSLALGASEWKLEHYLLAHLFQAFSGTPHPGLPNAVEKDDDRQKILDNARERAKERKDKLASGEIN